LIRTRSREPTILLLFGALALDQKPLDRRTFDRCSGRAARRIRVIRITLMLSLSVGAPPPIRWLAWRLARQVLLFYAKLLPLLDGILTASVAARRAVVSLRGGGVVARSDLVNPSRVRNTESQTTN